MLLYGHTMVKLIRKGTHFVYNKCKNQKKCKKNLIICCTNKFCLYLQKISDYMTEKITKKRLVTALHNLTAEQQEEVKALYPRGFSEVMTRIDKPNGDFFYVVPYETAEVSYLVKIDVKIDDGAEDDNSDEFYDEDEIKGADEIADDMGDDDM